MHFRYLRRKRKVKRNMANRKRAIAEYLFEFIDPVPWRSSFEFERDLADFFGANGVEAEIVSLVEGYSGPKIISLTRSELLDPKQMMTQPVEVKKMKDQFKNLKTPTGKKVKK